jgi:outer membrane protein
VPRLKLALVAAASAIALIAVIPPAFAESVAQALAYAYADNTEINSARAQTRADDENVPIARSARLPSVSIDNQTTWQTTDIAPLSGKKTVTENAVALTVTQPIFTGFRVTNAIRQSEAGVLASRELLRNTVENVLFDAAQAYADVIRDTAILDIRRKNVLFLDEQVRAANERFNVGENTRTDVAQARAAAAQARAAVAQAESNLATSRATYRQVIGHEARGLIDGFPYGRLIPRGLQQAVDIGQNEHPIILAAIHQADATAFTIKQIEGELLPSVSMEGSVGRLDTTASDRDPNLASVVGRISIPIFPGGDAVYPRIRQAKERYGQARIEVDVNRDQVRAAVVSAWAQAEAAVGAISAAHEGITAAEVALSGVQEEQKVGQRTTLDVLDAQQVLLQARETLVLAERAQIVAYFAVLSAMGRLTAEALSLPTEPYDPTHHYRAVRGKLVGTSTPDGR